MAEDAAAVVSPAPSSAIANNVITQTAPAAASPVEDTPIASLTGPVPLSFPALLRNPGLAGRFAHLQDVARERPAAAVHRKSKRDEPEGKRWIRRRENAKFTGNPHIIFATRKDYGPPAPAVRSTFPKPLPAYLPRTSAVPAGSLPVPDPTSANAGRFSLSLKGMRRTLRRAGAHTQALVLDLESALVAWLGEGGTMLSPDEPTTDPASLPGTPIGETGVVRELIRTPLQLVWSIADDAFARYVVHCCARYHEVVSYSKDHSGRRLTYLLRPNVTRPDFQARNTVDTPPVTDLEYSSHASEIETDLDAVSEPDLEGVDAWDAARTHTPPPSGPALSAIGEDEILEPVPPVMDDGWSVIGGDSDGAEGVDESGYEREGEDGADIARGVRRLSLKDEDKDPVINHDPPSDTDSTPSVGPRDRRRRVALHTRVWERQTRAASSPSRSPARRPPRRVIVRVDPPKALTVGRARSFYEYLYS